MTSPDTTERTNPPRPTVRTVVLGLALIVLAPLVITGAINLQQFQVVYRHKVESELTVMIERQSSSSTRLSRTASVMFGSSPASTPSND